MGLFTNNANGGFVDAIRCDEQSYLIWKWRPSGSGLGDTHRENAIRWGSPIRVKAGSVAVFVYSGNDGFYQDFIPGPSEVLAETGNLPVLASIIGLAYNGSTPFQAEVYYINLAETVQTKFAVPYFDVFDPELREFSVPVAVRGSIDFNITDYEDFVKKHRLDDFSVEDLQAQIKDAVIENVKSIVGNAPERYELPVIQIERVITEIKAEALESLREKFSIDYGVFLKDINIVALDINKESEGYRELKSVTKDLTIDRKKAEAKVAVKDISANQKLGVFGKAANMVADINERRKQNQEDREKRRLQNFEEVYEQRKESQENIYERRKETQHKYREEYEAELAGKVGAAGAKIIGAFGKNKKDTQRGGSDVPPPLPVISYHVALFGQPAGPFDMPTLKKMEGEGNLKEDTLVWKEGMDNWVAAGDIEELRVLFESGSKPPAIPS